ncbi:hypothetical protein CMI37_29005 [Candidatus Pacearchaeota archaeon]|nr:hypothetical protein [Candidatus Pacearchaeota archaeon]|tara:strand:+ start:2557 stop:4125 length:1569 start_codon:yes stop_codon:yes gene_type:complete
MNINTENITNAENQLELAHKDLIAFGKLFLPNDFLRSETPFFHYEMADSIDNANVKQLAIILPRGHGKTVLTKASILKDFLFCPKDDMHFYAWVSATHKLSVGNMDYIKHHLEFNDKILYFFGALKGNKWTEEDVELTNGCKLISKSNVAGIRGGAKLHKRYDLIILDDFEHEQNTITPESRDKNANLVTAVVYPALEPHTGRLRVNGTPVHYDSFINNLLINHGRAIANNKTFAWKVITYKAELPDGGVLWDSFFSQSKLEEKKKFYRDSGQPQKYFQEYMMEVQSEEDSVWRRSEIKYWKGYYNYDTEKSSNFLIIDGEEVPINTFVGCDPATDINTKHSDFSVIMAIAIDPDNNLYVLEYERHRSIPTIGSKGYDGAFINKKGVVDYIMEMHEKYHCVSSTVEDVAMNRSIFQALNTERRRLNKFSIAVIPEKPGGREKRNKVYSGLSGRFSMGTIHLRENMFDLINEILTFGPKMAHDDTVETLFYAQLHAFPPNMVKNKDKKDWFKPIKKAKSWIVA